MTPRFSATISTNGGAIIIFDNIEQTPIYKATADGYHNIITFKTLAAAKGQATRLNNRINRNLEN